MSPEETVNAFCEALNRSVEESLQYIAKDCVYQNMPFDPVVGPEELRRLRPLTDKPLVAIGGITRENAGQVLAAGANSLAVVSDFLGPDVDARLREWTRIAKGGGDAV